ncbi:VanW family protein [Geomicrobium sp. JCM 19055]|uniref:VanW family protein n=1 Tax=Geomicrobium sp. JCM 19055 TaxID=1460649 RepID=UPI00045ED37D|nr:VanW family protein [Geomicrobium sp. JCM 19055]GAK00250.1 vancomycin B-type resistance protein VanW [Geomicrobium sp. JCM 19055]
MKPLRLLPIVGLFVLSSACGVDEEVMASAPVFGEKPLHELRETPTHKVSVYDENDEDFHVEFTRDELQEDELRSFAKELARGENGYDQSMKTPKNIDGQVEGGQDQVILDENALVENILNHSYYHDSIKLPIEVTSPNVTDDDLQAISDETIGSFSTSFDASTTGRVENIRLSTESIHRSILGPGDRFSFHEVVGPATAERGYQEANVIVDGEFTNGMGGGICQTSTTLYNAVERAGLDIVERHHHSLPISYVPEGDDAMVSWGWADFKFENGHDFPVMITGSVDASSGQVTFEVTAAESI